MRTVSGRKIYLLDPQPEDYNCLEDIAHHLSLTNRYNGGTERPWSVAQHSLFMSKAVPFQYALEALLHDAHEMVVGDNITPMKRACPELKKLDGMHELAMRRCWGLPDTISEVVKTADGKMFATEVRQLRPLCDYKGPGDVTLEPYDAILFNQDWMHVRKEFLERARALIAHRLYSQRHA
jgi:hypothetical protein